MVEIIPKLFSFSLLLVVMRRCWESVPTCKCSAAAATRGIKKYKHARTVCVRFPSPHFTQTHAGRVHPCLRQTPNAALFYPPPRTPTPPPSIVHPRYLPNILLRQIPFSHTVRRRHAQHPQAALFTVVPNEVICNTDNLNLCARFLSFTHLLVG